MSFFLNPELRPHTLACISSQKLQPWSPKGSVASILGSGVGEPAHPLPSAHPYMHTYKHLRLQVKVQPTYSPTHNSVQVMNIATGSLEQGILGLRWS